MKVAKTVYSILCLLFFSCAAGQECEWLNVGTGNGYGGAITVDNNNDVLVTGRFFPAYFFTMSGHKYTNTVGRPNAVLAKYSSEGVFLWGVQSYASSGSCGFLDVKTDKENNIYVTGFCVGTSDFGNGITLAQPATSKKHILIKYNTSGTPLWIRTFAVNAIDKLRLTVDNKGEIYVGFSFNGSFNITGSSLITSSGDYDIGIVKYDSAGNHLLATHFGGTARDEFVDIENDTTGNVYIIGKSRGGMVFGTNNLTGDGEVLLKTSSSLSPVLGIKNQGSISPVGLAVNDNGNVVVTGTLQSGLVSLGGLTDSLLYNYIVYYDAGFRAQWLRSNKIPTLTGTIFSQPIHLFFSNDPTPAGITIRNNQIYFGGVFQGIIQFGDFAVNQADALYRAQNKLYFVKMDTLGNFLWAFGSGNPGYSGHCEITDLAADSNGNCLVTGEFVHKVTIFNEYKTGDGNGGPLDVGLFTAKITDYSITRGNVYPGPYCAGDSITIPYTLMGKYQPGNEFIAQLSDSAGNFEGEERELGRLTDTVAGTIKGILPLFDVATSGKYRIRILSTKPGVQSFYRKDLLRLLIYSKDTANAGPDTAICRGESIRLGTTGGSKWVWWPASYMPNLADTSNRQPLITPDFTTEYRIIISDNSGCGRTDTDYVKVIVTQPITITAPDTVYYCSGTTAAIKATASGGNPDSISFKWWDGSDTLKTVLTNVDSLIVAPDLPKEYWVLATDNCFKDSVKIWVIKRPPLQVSRNADTILCKGNSLQLKATPSGGLPSTYKILWSDGSGWTDTNLNVTVTPVATTTYTAVLTDNCTVKPDTAKVVITVREPLKITLNNDTTICVGETAQLRATTAGGQPLTHNILWTADSGPWTDNTSITTVTPAVTTTYKAVLTDNCTVKGDSALVKVIVRTPLSLSVNPDATICTGQTTQLRATPSGGLPSAYKINWSEVGGQWLDSIAIVNVSPTSTTTYKAVLTDNCTTNNDSSTVTVTVRPPLSIKVNQDDSICQNQTVLLTATVSGGNTVNHSILWTVDRGPWTSPLYSVTDTPQVTSLYIATLSDNCSTPASDTVLITVLPSPRADFDFFPKQGCPPLEVSFTDLSYNHDTTKNTWKIQANDVFGVSSHTQLFSYTGTYDVGLTVINSLNCSDNIVKKGAITIFEKPKAGFTVKPEIIEAEKEIYLINQSQRATTYTWDMNDGSLLKKGNLKDTTYSYKDTGNFTISLIAENNQGCKDTAKQNVRIHDRLTCIIPNAFTPNNYDNLNSTFSPVCTGLKTYTLTIYNRWGQAIHQSDNSSWDGSYEGEIVPQGVYMYKIQIQAENGRKETLYGTVNVLR